jgi:polysaccharide pyruvyl transferase WcaK-like protein/tetratricopeptide (TPR) repeat protein
VASLRRVLAADPRSASVWRQLGDAYRADGAFAEAQAAYDTALNFAPNGDGIRWQKAMAWLAAGDFTHGWAAHEFRPAARPPNRPAFAMPEWGEEPLRDKRILVYGEQGLGDEIMFSSCIPNLAAAASRVVLLCNPRLAPLFARAFPEVEICGERRLEGPPPNLDGAADLAVLAGSLPRVFRAEEAAFAGGAAFLQADPVKLARWQTRFAPYGDALRVGISWRGGLGALVRERRALPVAGLARLLRTRNIVVVNLQYGDCSEELRLFGAEHELTVLEWSDSDPTADIDDFAAKMAALDLVISADNTTVHLGGALGVETWVALPAVADWRWMTSRDDTPWYGSLKLFRQAQPGDWSPVMAALGTALDRRARKAVIREQQPVTSLGRPRPRVALLNDTTDWYHWGCTCTSGAIHLVGRGFSIDPVPITESYRCRETPRRIADFKDPAFFDQFRSANKPLIDRIAASDRVIINGEGTIHGTTPVVLNLLYLAYAATIHLAKPVHLINHSCFPEGSANITHEPTRALYRLVYAVMADVVVREPVSQGILRKLGIDATLGFDSLPLYVASNHSAAPAASRRGVVIAGSVAWQRESLPALAHLMRVMMEHGHSLTVLTGARANPARDDAHFVEALRETIADGWDHFDARSAAEWLDTLGRARLLVSGRFHHTIAALCLGTPAIVLNSNTPKMEGLLSMTGQRPPIAFDAPDLANILVARAEEALVDGGPPLNAAALDQIRGLAERNFTSLDQDQPALARMP